jgi:hypothetical protein
MRLTKLEYKNKFKDDVLIEWIVMEFKHNDDKIKKVIDKDEFVEGDWHLMAEYPFTPMESADVIASSIPKKSAQKRLSEFEKVN